MTSPRILSDEVYAEQDEILFERLSRIEFGQKNQNDAERRQDVISALEYHAVHLETLKGLEETLGGEASRKTNAALPIAFLISILRDLEVGRVDPILESTSFPNNTPAPGFIDIFHAGGAAAVEILSRVKGVFVNRSAEQVAKEISKIVFGIPGARDPYVGKTVEGWRSAIKSAINKGNDGTLSTDKLGSRIRLYLAHVEDFEAKDVPPALYVKGLLRDLRQDRINVTG